MAGKGREYWLEVWDGCNFPEPPKEDPLFLNGYCCNAAKRLLKRYGYLWTPTTYGPEVNRWFNAGIISYLPHRHTLDDVIKKLKEAISNKPIKEDGDLHEILKIIGEKAFGDAEHYVKEFTIESRKSFFESVMSFFCCYPSHTLEQTSEKAFLTKGSV